MAVRLIVLLCGKDLFPFNNTIIAPITSLAMQSCSLHKNLSRFSTFPSGFHFSLLLVDLEILQRDSKQQKSHKREKEIFVVDSAAVFM